MTDDDHPKDDEDELSSDNDSSANEDSSTVDEIQDALDQNGGDPMVVLDHRQWPYLLAEWHISDDYDKMQNYQKVVNHINWRSVEMRRDAFNDQIQRLADEIRSSESRGIPGMTAKEFRGAFRWENTLDRRTVYYCHLWCKENAHIAFSNNQVFVYNGRVWVDDQGQVAQILQRLLGQDYGSHIKNEFIEGYVTVKDAYQVDWDEMGVSGPRCVVENGILDLVEGEIEREVRPDDYALMQFPVTWEGPDASCGIWVNEFLSRSVNDADLQKLQEFAGYCLHSHDYPYKKALMMLGDGNNGKGVFEDVITAVMGPNNVTNYGLQDLSGAEFGLQRLQNTAVNINSDIEDGKITHTSAVKKLTGRDRFKVEPKYETPFEIENAAKLMFAANRIPKVSNKDLAFYARWLFVEFPRRFTTRDDEYLDADPHITEKIIESELPGVLAWMVEGYQRLHDQQHFSEALSPEEVRDEWEHLAKPTVTFVRNFVKEGYPPGDGDPELDTRMTVSGLYDYYVKYMEATPVSPVSKGDLYREITRRNEADTETERRGPEEVVRVWDGVFIPHNKRQEIKELYTESL